MPYISQSSIQEVTDRLDAVAVVSDYVQIEKKSGRYWACCPFHQEKTPSFTVSPEFKTYHCFGCQKGGTIVNFIMEMDKLSFPEAIEFLAKKYGIELKYEKSADPNFSADEEARKKAKEELFELYKRISFTFHHFLLKRPESEQVMRYIISRGISIEMIERFRLGYSPADRNWLHKFLVEKNYSGEFLASSGLFSSRYPEMSLFSGRLMFPIADRQGRIVAFGGRFMEGQTEKKDGYDPPKYINSPEQGIYKKGETLFAVDFALPEIRRTKTAYIAEGYMDVIALHQAGITNAVAPLGTAFTDEQARLLRRWAEKIILFFDSDNAGQDAAIKGIYTCRRNGLACAVVAPEAEKSPGGSGNTADILSQDKTGAESLKDPADILKNLGIEALHNKAKCFINDFDYLVTRASSLNTVSESASGRRTRAEGYGKARAIAFLFPYFDLLDSEVARNSCIENAADSFGLLPKFVSDDYERYRQEKTGGKKEETSNRQPGKAAETPIIINDELLLLMTVAVDFITGQKEKLFLKFRAALKINDVNDPNAKELYIALEECIRYGENSMDEFLARITSPGLRDFILSRSASGEFFLNSGKYVSDGINTLKIKSLERRKEEIFVILRSIKKEEEQDSEAKVLLAEIMDIDSKLSQLKQGR